MDHAAALESIVHWGETDANIRVVALEGSLARDDASVDPLSDVDIRLYVTNPQPLLDTRDWYEQFGEVLVVEALANPGWFPTRLVYYVDGKIDFTIAPVTSLVGRERFGRRVRVLVDKDAITATIGPGRPATVSLPDESTFLTCVNEFYAAGLMYARMLVRDEPIKAKYRDWDMKTRLVQMIEWEHVARYGATHDVRPFGGHFRQWADDDVAAALDACWTAGLDPSRSALRATIALFRTTSDRVGRAIGWRAFESGPVLREIDRILALHV